MIIVGPTIYLLACAIIGYFGRRYRLGYWGYFFLSFFLTPAAGIIALIAAMPVDRMNQCEQCCEELEKSKRKEAR